MQGKGSGFMASRTARLLGALALAAVWMPAPSPAQTVVLEQVLVKVNGEIITKTDLEDRQVSALRQRNRNVTADDLETDAELRRVLDEVTPQLLVDAVDEMIIVQRGRELGYRLSDEQFTRILANIREENKIETDEQFQAALRQEGMTIDDLRRSLERTMIIQQVQGDAVGRVTMTEGEARSYYDNHPNEFTTPASVTLREILVAVPAAQPPAGTTGSAAQPMFNVALEEEALEKARALRTRALAGEDFGQIAANESDAASKANGGLIGPIQRDELDPRLETLIETLQVGDVTEPLRTPRGFQLLKLESLTPATRLTFDQARDQIAGRVVAEKRQAEFEKYMSRLRDQAIIEWKNEPLRQVYEKARAAGRAPRGATSNP